MIDKEMLIEVLKKNAVDLKSSSLNLAGKSEAMSELLKIVEEGAIDHKSKEEVKEASKVDDKEVEEEYFSDEQKEQKECEE